MISHFPSNSTLHVVTMSKMATVNVQSRSHARTHFTAIFIVIVLIILCTAVTILITLRTVLINIRIIRTGSITVLVLRLIVLTSHFVLVLSILPLLLMLAILYCTPRLWRTYEDLVGCHSTAPFRWLSPPHWELFAGLETWNYYDCYCAL